jgi:hypothetical protein
VASTGPQGRDLEHARAWGTDGPLASPQGGRAQGEDRLDLTGEHRKDAGSGARLRIGSLDGTTRVGTWTRSARGGLMDLWRHPKEATTGRESGLQIGRARVIARMWASSAGRHIHGSATFPGLQRLQSSGTPVQGAKLWPRSPSRTRTRPWTTEAAGGQRRRRAGSELRPRRAGVVLCGAVESSEGRVAKRNARRRSFRRNKVRPGEKV